MYPRTVVATGTSPPGRWARRPSPYRAAMGQVFAGQRRESDDLVRGRVTAMTIRTAPAAPPTIRPATAGGHVVVVGAAPAAVMWSRNKSSPPVTRGRRAAATATAANERVDGIATASRLVMSRGRRDDVSRRGGTGRRRRRHGAAVRGARTFRVRRTKTNLPRNPPAIPDRRRRE